MHAGTHSQADQLHVLDAQGSPSPGPVLSDTDEDDLIGGQGAAENGGTAGAGRRHAPMQAGSVAWAKLEHYPWWPAQVSCGIAV